MDNYNITVNNSTFGGDSSIVHNDYRDKYSSVSMDELKDIQKELWNTADKLEKLQEAIQKRDDSKISRIISDLSKGTASSILANIASAGLKRLLKI